MKGGETTGALHLVCAVKRGAPGENGSDADGLSGYAEPENIRHA